jgi:hypothetical protein
MDGFSYFTMAFIPLLAIGALFVPEEDESFERVLGGIFLALMAICLLMALISVGRR